MYQDMISYLFDASIKTPLSSKTKPLIIDATDTKNTLPLGQIEYHIWCFASGLNRAGL